MAEAREEHRMLLTEVAHEDIRRIGIGQHRPEVAVVDIDPVLHRHIVRHLVAEHRPVELNPFVGMRPRDTEPVLVGEVDVTRTEEVLPRVLLQELSH